jgi:uncharacterized membrane protein YhhN
MHGIMDVKKYWPVIPPVILYVLYEATGVFWFRFSIIAFLLCYVLLLIFARTDNRTRGKYLFIPCAFFLSIIGDLFLHYDEGRAPLFIAGVVFYFIAHLSYIGFTLRKGKVNWWLMLLLCIGFGVYYILLLRPGISNPAIRIAVVAYILVSSLSLSTAAAMPVTAALWRTTKILIICGIASLAISDAILALHDFGGIGTGYFLMLPLFYMSQILVTCALIHQLKPTIS